MRARQTLPVLLVPAALLAVVTVVAVRGAPQARAQATPPTNCKTAGSGKCCDPAVSQHLTKEAIFAVCGESDASYLGEKGSKDTCRYVFKGPDPAAKEEAFVEIYAPAAKEVPDSPSDPFFAWKKVGRVFITDKAKTPKTAPMLEKATGLWMPGKGFYLQVNASTKVCTKAEATRLARSMN